MIPKSFTYFSYQNVDSQEFWSDFLNLYLEKCISLHLVFSSKKDQSLDVIRNITICSEFLRILHAGRKSMQMNLEMYFTY